MFDVLNSHSGYGKGFKSPLNRSNIDFTERFLGKAVDYLGKLTLKDGKPLMSTRRKTFLIGFQSAADSYIRLGRSLFSKYPDVKFLLAYKLGQDHIETLFSKIRSRGGFNNNPNVVQFTSAIKGLRVKTEVTPSANANCLELDDSNTALLRPTSVKTSTSDDDVDIGDTCEKLDIGSLDKPISDIVTYISK